MLQIKEISKQYRTESLIQQALDKVSLNLRDNEFVAILGPSGSGKTTLLNIIGGLDRYDSGDLIINSISTKNYSDRDWDSYRNHTIGFVFQSYNLIPHQTILSNVELALTISGVSKADRKKRAQEALEKVGLGDHIQKRPNQLSGGQMQRVAIARALVNDPDILLADEPTGALDSTTSVQVMDLLKEVAKDRLVVMVTHNPELAEEYATRIVRLRDGKIIDDTDPFVIDSMSEPAVHKNMGKSSMSFLTAFGLSANNLLTKKGRTILTAFAGSIGIIGIALILSLSTGFQNYIDKIQEDTLTSYPLTITQETADVTSALLSMVADSEEGSGEGVIKEQQAIATMFSKIGTNDLKSFIEHLNKNEEIVDENVSLIQYKYSISPLIYTNTEASGLTQLNPSTMMATLGGSSSMDSMAAMTGSSGVFNEMLDDPSALKESYDVVVGTWPKKYDEVILVLQDPETIPDLLVYSLGLRNSDELISMISKIMAQEKVEEIDDPLTFTQEDLMNLEFKLIDASDKYKYNAQYNIYEDMSQDEAYMKKVYDNSETLKIVGIVTPKEGSSSMTLSPGIAYTKELTQHVIEKASESEIVKKQLENKDINVFSNKSFDDETKEAGLNFQDMISIDTDKLASAFGGNMNQEDIAKMTQGYMTKISEAIDADTSKAEAALKNTLIDLSKDLLNKYIEENKTSIESSGIDQTNITKIVQQVIQTLQSISPEIQIDVETLTKTIESILQKMEENGETTFVDGAYIQKEQIKTIVSEYMKSETAQAKMAELSEQYVLPKEAFTSMFEGFLNGLFETIVSMTTNEESKSFISSTMVEPMTSLYAGLMDYTGATKEIAIMMNETVMQKTILTNVGEMTGELISSIASAMNVDPAAIASAFQFNLNEEELMRLLTTMNSSGVEKNANTNLISLGYQKIDEPASISFYFNDFESKERFIEFLDTYNEDMEKEDDEKVIKYTDLTGFLMSSVKTIVDSVSYVLIAFVSISLVVSSIMIGIITYISVLERTKEIGVLRAIGASKKNISSIFNAETFIIGLFSGLLGIGVTLALIPIINYVIHSVTGNTAINAALPVVGGIVLVILSVILTLIGGLIPSKQAATKDPVTALRSE